MAEALHLIISGKVQGVFYRATCQETATLLGLKGWVRNLPTGQVELMAEGDRVQLDRLLEWCRQGPPNARVDDIEIGRPSPPPELPDDFEIRHD